MSKPSNLSKINLVILALFAASFVGLKIWQYWWPKADIELAGETLHVLVANTPTHQYRGLGKRDSIAPYDGMLFTFTFPRRVAIVMRDIPSDINMMKIRIRVIIPNLNCIAAIVVKQIV